MEQRQQKWRRVVKSGKSHQKWRGFVKTKKLPAFDDHHQLLTPLATFGQDGEDSMERVKEMCGRVVKSGRESSKVGESRQKWGRVIKSGEASSKLRSCMLLITLTNF